MGRLVNSWHCSDFAGQQQQAFRSFLVLVLRSYPYLSWEPSNLPGEPQLCPQASSPHQQTLGQPCPSRSAQNLSPAVCVCGEGGTLLVNMLFLYWLFFLTLEMVLWQLLLLDP